MTGQRITVIAAAVALASAAGLTVDAVGDTLLAKMLVLLIAAVTVTVYGIVSGHDSRLSYLADPMFLISIFFAQFYVVGAISMYFGGGLHSTFAYPYPRERMGDVLVAFLLLTVMMMIGYRLRLGRIIADVIPEFRPAPGKLAGRWIETAIIVAAVAGCLGAIAFQGGLLERLSMGYGQKRYGGALFRIAYVGVQAGTLLMAWRVFRTAKGNLIRWAPLIALVAFQFLFFGIVMGVRKYLLFLFFGMLTVWVLSRGKESLPKLRVALTMALLLAFFSIWGVVRSGSVTSLVGLEPESGVGKRTHGVHEGYLGAVDGPFSTVCLVFDLFPDQEPYRYGQTLHVALVGFIPRALWPEKPIGFGTEITPYIEGPYATRGRLPGQSSFATTLMGDFYINFGWMGIVAGGMFLGVLCRVVATYATAGMRDGIQTRAARVLIPAVFIMGLGEVRADMATSLTTYGLSLAPVLVALTFFNLEPVIASARVVVQPAAEEA